MDNLQGKEGAKRLLAYQLVVTTAFAAVAGLLLGPNACKSAVLGGLVCIIPQAYFARKLFKYSGANAAKKIVGNFYKGEALKIFLSVLLFTLVFKFSIIMPPVFFAVYLVTQLVFWFSPLIFVNQYYGSKSD